MEMLLRILEQSYYSDTEFNNYVLYLLRSLDTLTYYNIDTKQSLII
jgi:hypothetical protein